jgi:hypothetical protein
LHSRKKRRDEKGEEGQLRGSLKRRYSLSCGTGVSGECATLEKTDKLQVPMLHFYVFFSGIISLHYILISVLDILMSRRYVVAVVGLPLW